MEKGYMNKPKHERERTIVIREPNRKSCIGLCEVLENIKIQMCHVDGKLTKDIHEIYIKTLNDRISELENYISYMKTIYDRGV